MCVCVVSSTTCLLHGDFECVEMCSIMFHRFGEVWGWHHSAQVAMIHEIKSEGMQPRVSTNREFQDTLSLQGPVQGSLLDIFRLLILSWY